MFKLVQEPKRVRLTKRFVKEFKELPPCPGNRRLDKRRLRSLREAEKRGELRPPEWAWALCRQTGDKYKLNGNHTTELFLELPASKLKEHSAIMSGYVCDTLEDVAKLYGTFDPRSSARTQGDLSQAVASSDELLAGLPQYFRNCLVAGLGYHREGVSEKANGKLTAMERSVLLLEDRDFISWVFRLLSTADNDRYLLRRAVVAAMYETYRVAGKVVANKFWTKVKDGSDPNSKSPTRLLQMYLLRHSVSLNARSSTRNATPREMYCKCVAAWNAFRKKAPTDLRYHPDSPLPKVV
jgi:hypothetical protein